MDPVTLVLVLLGMVCMLLSFVTGVYVVLNQEPVESQPLLSAEDLAALSADLEDDADQVRWSNVSGARMGFDSGTLISTLTDTEPARCARECGSRSQCQGFQLYGANSCDLLANVSTTYAFTDATYNLVTSSSAVPLNILGEPVQGEIGTNHNVAMTPSPAPVDTVYKCARACKRQEGTCKSFSWSETAGCKLKKASSQRDADVAPVDQNGYSSYFLKGVTHDVWTAAPSPS